MFAIAEKVGRTVEELEEDLSVDELFEWAAWFEFQAKQQKAAMERAKAQSASGRGRRWR